MITPLSGKVAEICLAHGNRPDALIEILHDIQSKFGHLPETNLPQIADSLNLSRAEVYGVVTFYHDFHLKPQGKHVIKICRAEACQSMGGTALIAALEKQLKVKLGETTADKKITLEATYCLGLCASAPSLMIDGTPQARVTLTKAKALLKELA